MIPTALPFWGGFNLTMILKISLLYVDHFSLFKQSTFFMAL